MKQFEANGHRCLVVDVPKGASGFFIYTWPEGRKVLYTNSESETDWYKNLPKKSNWQIVGTGTADKIEEAEWKEILKSQGYDNLSEIVLLTEKYRI